MEKFLYSRKGKGLFLFLQHICVLGLTICITFIMLFSTVRYQGKGYAIGVSPFDNASTFEGTSAFRVMLDDSVKEIVKYAVIREQMETDGVFDGKKKINIEAYAKRYQREAVIGSKAEYYLEDLIKWGQYGVEDAVEGVTSEEAYYYESNGTDKNFGTTAVQADDSSELQITAQAADGVELIIAEEAVQEMQEPITSTVLERYKPIGGSSLTAYASNQEEYYQLVGSLIESIESLSYNYYEYKQFQTLYQENKTNMHYYIETETGEGKKQFSNLPDEIQQDGEEAYIKELGRYLCYDAKALSYTTNTDISEEELADILRTYEYAYSDNSRVLIGLDMAYPVMDIFSSANSNFNAIGEWVGPVLITMVVCGCFAFVLFLMLTLVSGRKRRVEEVSLLWFDRINTECSLLIALLLSGAVMVVTALAVSGFYNTRDTIQQLPVLSTTAIGVLLSHMLLMFFYLSLVRRIKSHTLWKNSITHKIWAAFRRGMTGIFRKMKIFTFRFLDHGKVTTRTWIPYSLFLGFNLSCLFLTYSSGAVTFWIAVVFDILVGYYLFRENVVRQRIVDGIERIKDGDMSYQVDTTGMHGEVLVLAESVNTLGAAIRKAVETSMKDERLKSDLITNVSHDIKTPLTSIINYVDLIKREEINDDKIKGYVAILDAKSQRLKHLTEDLVEASKISSGNITLQMTRLNLVELLNQTIGEFSENFDNRGLQLIVNMPEHALVIEADSRRIWRVFENLFRNIEKYAMENTRIYLDILEEEKESGRWVSIYMKNISKYQLNIDAEDLTQRFIRGDVSRSTEGSGLGLSIAKNLVQLQGGLFEIYLDGDLFKVTMSFQVVREP